MIRRSILVGPGIREQLDSYDKNLKSKFIRAFRFLSKDLGHPSLHAETVKMGAVTFYRVRVDLNHRIHLELKGDFYLVLAIGPHRLQGIG